MQEKKWERRVDWRRSERKEGVGASGRWVSLLDHCLSLSLFLPFHGWVTSLTDGPSKEIDEDGVGFKI